MLRCYVSYKILYELVTVPEINIMLHVNYASINKKKSYLFQRIQIREGYRWC